MTDVWCLGDSTSFFICLDSRRSQSFLHTLVPAIDCNDYTPANKVVGVYWFQHDCPSIRLSMEKRFPHDKSITFWQWWYFIPGLRRSFTVKRSRSNWDLHFVPCRHDNFISFWHTMIILNTLVDHDPRTEEDFCWFGGSKFQLRPNWESFNLLPQGWRGVYICPFRTGSVV